MTPDLLPLIIAGIASFVGIMVAFFIISYKD